MSPSRRRAVIDNGNQESLSNVPGFSCGWPITFHEESLAAHDPNLTARLSADLLSEYMIVKNKPHSDKK